MTALWTLTSSSTVVLAGDSITGPFNCWRDLRNDISRFYGGTVTVQNSGISSAGVSTGYDPLADGSLNWSTSIYSFGPIVTYVNHYIASYGPTHVIFFIGVNDCAADSGSGYGTGYVGENFTDGLSVFTDQLFGYVPSLVPANVLYVSPWHFRDGQYPLADAAMADATTRMRALADSYGFGFLDLYTTRGDVNAETADQVHPNELGRGILTNHILGKLDYKKVQKS